MKKQKPSSVRMRESGKHPIQLWLTAEQKEILARVAQAEGRPMANALLFHGMRAIETILKNLAE